MAALGILALFIQGLRFTSRSKESVKAAHFGQQFLESVKNFDRSSLPDTSNFDGFSDPPGPSGFPPPPYPSIISQGRTFTFQVRTEVVQGNVISVQTRVFWNETESKLFEVYVRK